ncbi:MAG: hypothetical protein ACOCWA_04750 [Bacteroidota bacterium]
MRQENELGFKEHQYVFNLHHESSISIKIPSPGLKTPMTRIKNDINHHYGTHDQQ